MLNELGGAVGGGGSARNAEVEFGPYTSVLSKATALDVPKLAGVASATRPVEGTGWRIERFVRDEGSYYVAVLG